jgi:hypothetical protein
MDGNTISANSAKTPITNQPNSTPFQAFTNGNWLALVSARSGSNLESHANDFQDRSTRQRGESHRVPCLWTGG